MHFQDLKCLPVDYPFHIAAYTEDEEVLLSVLKLAWPSIRFKYNAA